MFSHKKFDPYVLTHVYSKEDLKYNMNKTVTQSKITSSLTAQIVDLITAER